MSDTITEEINIINIRGERDNIEQIEEIKAINKRGEGY